MEIDSSEVKTHLKMFNYENTDDFKVQDVEKFPNRHICFVQIKIYNGENLMGNSKRSGVLIDQKYLLTAAHNFKKYGELTQKLKKIHIEPIVHSVIKLALHEGTSRGEYSIKQIHMSTKYNSSESSLSDYALVQIEPNGETIEKDELYPIVLALSEQSITKIKEISIYGYPILTNQNAHSNPAAQSSIFIKNQYKSTGPLRKTDGFKISYSLPTEPGISGGPVFAQHKGQSVVIAIHKASVSSQLKSQSQSSSQYNFGVCAAQMLEEMNDWGYSIRRRPFIFTEKTLKIKEEEEAMANREILSFMDKGFDAQDIRVITSYDLTKLTKIILSGNHLRDEGLQCLTSREFPNIQSLYLNQNEIRSLEHLPEMNWRNISTLRILGLSINGLTDFADHFALLERLQHLWLSYNQFKEIPNNFIDFCKSKTSNLNVYFYNNKVKDEKHLNQMKKEGIANSKVRCFWNKEDAREFFP